MPHWSDASHVSGLHEAVHMAAGPDEVRGSGPIKLTRSKRLENLGLIQSPGRPVDGRTITVCATAAPGRDGFNRAPQRRYNLLSPPQAYSDVRNLCWRSGQGQHGRRSFRGPAWDFQSGKRVRDKENTQFSIRAHQLHAPTRVRTHVEQIRDDQNALAKLSADYDGDAPNMTRIVLGPVASGSAVLAEGEVVKEIKAQHGDLVGVEMEIYGLFCRSLRCGGSAAYAFRSEGGLRLRRSEQGGQASALCV
jgi:hypothetical protein